MIKSNVAHAVGKRKRAIARVFIKNGSGNITINKETCSDYFGRETSIMVAKQALAIIEGLESYDVTVNVTGGGKSGQAGAIRHGIARALLVLNPDFRKSLKPAGYLTRDAREVERKKYGRHKARKRPQFSKR
jgi:small subunit ribosomal protein S9